MGAEKNEGVNSMMKQIHKYLVFVMLVFVAVITACSNVGEQERVVVQLEQVHDGDTIRVIYNGKAENVRFLLIDTPETSHPTKGEQPYGQEAKQLTKQLVENAKKIELEFDQGPKRDKYDRLLAYVYADGKMVQKELLKQGLARVAYVYEPNTRYVDEFRAIEQESRKQKIGVWEVEGYAQNDGFHPEVMKEEKQTSANGCDIKGNINSKGEKIYHTPDSPWYEQTKPEVWFCSENEAISSGFRKAKYN
jgi:micrococcal nuclease